MQKLVGIKRNNQLCVSLNIAGTQGHPAEVVVAVDTGFSGFLSLPFSLAEPHGLEAAGSTMATFANGSRQVMPLARVNVGFATCTRPGVALVTQSDSHPLIGLAFLRVFDLTLVATHDKLALTTDPELKRWIGEA